MGLFSSIFGGGSTKVTQTAQNKTDVTVTSQIANLIDITALAEAVKAMGASVQGAITTTGQQTQTLVSHFGQQTQVLIASLGKAQVLTQIAAVQEKAKQNEILTNSLKVAGVGVAGYLIWRNL